MKFTGDVAAKLKASATFAATAMEIGAQLEAAVKSGLIGQQIGGIKITAFKVFFVFYAQIICK